MTSHHGTPSDHVPTPALERIRAVGAWLDAERLVGNLHRAYSELRGEPLGAPLDFGPLVGEMVEWKGGPLRCLA